MVASLYMDGRESARGVWGAAPTGRSTALPGTRAFFEQARRFRDEIEQPWLADVVPFHEWRGKRVLEIGHGPGFDAYTILNAGADYTGIDLSPENVDRATRHLTLYGLTPNVQEGDAEALAFPDASFDVVYSNGVLHHVPDALKAFREARRVLKPGGGFYVLLYHRHSIFYWVTLGLWYQLIHGGWRKQSLRERVREIEHDGIHGKPIVNVYSRREVRRLLREAGFRVSAIRVRKLGPDDLPQVWYVHRWFRLVPQRAYDAIGAMFGWYVIGEAHI